MKTAVGDVIICQKPGVSVRLVAVVLNDGEEPDDVRFWRPEGRLSAEEIARANVNNTGGRIFRWDGFGELQRIDVD